MRKYDSYKDSGIEWIGEIPSHWEVKKVNYCFEQIGSGTTPTAGKPEFYENGEFNWLQTGDLNDGEIFETSKKISQVALNVYSTLRFYQQNSLVIAMYGATIGKTGLLNIESTTNQACCVLSKPKGLNHRFAFYWLNYVKPHVISLSYGGGQPNINQEQIRSLKIQLPPPQEQTAIAAYLDRKTAEIDELIADKKRLLELYEEEKTAIINEAVTTGLNHDLEGWADDHDFENQKEIKPSGKSKKSRFRHSGIEWLGEIPEHWEVKRFKYYFNLITEKVEEDLPKIGLENIESKSGKFIETDTDFAGQGVRFRPKDILFGKLRPYLAKVWLSNFDGQAVGDFYVFRSKQKVNPEFAKYRILDSSFIEITNSSTYGSKMPRVSWEFIADLPIAFPEIQEQQSIVQHIENECTRIDAKKAKTEKLIELLTEYHTALISEVVTGKIKVTQ